MLWIFGLLLLTATFTLGQQVSPAVQNLAVTEVRSSVIRLSWSALSATDLLNIRGYRICSTPNPGMEGCTDVLEPTINTYSITGLDSCTQFVVSVATLGNNNIISTPASLTITTAPSQVNSLGFSRRDDDTIMVLWWYNPPAGSSCATYFQLSICDSREINCTTTDVNLSGTYYTIQLHKSRDCNAYFLNVVAVDSNNQRSDNFRFDVQPDGIGVAENLSMTNSSSSTFDVQWGIPASQVNCDYRVTVEVQYRAGVTTYGATTRYDGGVTEHRELNVTSCTACNVSVKFGSTEGVESATTTAYTLPADDKIFDNVTVTEVTRTSVTVLWNTTLDIDQCVDVYSVCWEKQGTSSVDCRNTTSNTTSYQVTGLEASTKYQLSVSALLHTGVEYDNVTLDASTNSGATGPFHSFLIGISAIMICIQTFVI